MKLGSSSGFHLRKQRGSKVILAMVEFQTEKWFQYPAKPMALKLIPLATGKRENPCPFPDFKKLSTKFVANRKS
jgi:hypothetical protein